MFFDPSCIPCIISQALNSAKLFTNGDKELQLRIVKETCSQVKNVNKDYTAPLFSKVIQEIIEKNLGIENPYKKLKEKNLAEAKKYTPQLELILKNSQDKIECALRIAAAGNIIDVGANPDFNIEDEIGGITSNNIDLNELPRFKRDLKNAGLILYIGDNSEEALFDMFLLKELKPARVVFAVRSKPILNDVTLEDAYRLGIDKICEVIESGSTIAGTDLTECTPEFLAHYQNADVVISKGQGNYETLISEKRPIYFLFKVKCEAVANRSGFEKGRGVLLYNKNDKRNK